MAKKYKLNLKKLCTPSFLYFMISSIALLILGVQNVLNKDDDSFCIGNYSCNLGSKLLVFILNVIYVLVWTFILDLICKAGYSELSWIIVLIPFLLFFVLFGIMMYKVV